MAIKTSDNQNVEVNVVVWPRATRYLDALANREFRLASKGATEYERGRHAGRGEMCEQLRNLPQALALLQENEQDGTRKSGEQDGQQGA